MNPTSRHPQGNVFGSAGAFEFVRVMHWIAASTLLLTSFQHAGAVLLAYLILASLVFTITIGLTWRKEMTSHICKSLYLVIGGIAAIPTAISFLIACCTFPRYLQGYNGGTPASVVDLSNGMFPVAIIFWCIFMSIMTVSFLFMAVFVAHAKQTGTARSTDLK